MIAAAVPGTSFLHRAPAGAKLIGLAIAALGVALLREPWHLAVALGVTVGLFALARIPARAAVKAVAPVLWLLAVTVPVNAIFAGWESAATSGLRVVTIVGLAGLVTLTTTVTAVLQAVQTALRPFPRIDADRVGLLLALTIRAIPLLGEIVGRVLDARKARGAEGSLRAIAVPVVVRALKAADGLGEAMMARGYDD